MVKARVNALCTYMAVQFAHQETQWHTAADFETKEARETLTRGKTSWAAQMIGCNKLIGEMS